MFINAHVYQDIRYITGLVHTHPDTLLQVCNSLLAMILCTIPVSAAISVKFLYLFSSALLLYALTLDSSRWYLPVFYVELATTHLP